MLIRPMTGVAGAAALAAALSPASALAAEKMRIASGQPGTPWHAFGVALAQQYEAAVPGAKAVTVRRGNAYWNPIVVNARRAEFGISNAASAVWAYTGDDTAYGKKKYTDIRAVMAGLRPVWIAAMLHQDYIRNAGFSTLDRALRTDRGAPRIVMEPFSSVVPIVADKILASMGSSRRLLRERGGDVLQVAAAQIPSMIRGGRADLYFEAVGSDRAAALAAALADHDTLRRPAVGRARRAHAGRNGAILRSAPLRRRWPAGRNGRSRHHAYRSPGCPERCGARDAPDPDRRPPCSRPKPSGLAGLLTQPLRGAEDAGRADASRRGPVLPRTRLDPNGEAGTHPAAPVEAAPLNSRDAIPPPLAPDRFDVSERERMCTDCGRW